MRDHTGRLVLGLWLVAAAVPCSGSAVERLAFVTSVTGTGNLSSWPDASGSTPLARADAICRARAAAGGLANADTFRAWLSTGTTDAYCHVQGLSGKRSAGCGTGDPPTGGPWYNTDNAPGRPFLPPLEEVTGAGGSPYGPAQFDEFGAAVSALAANDRVWTGTIPDGSAWEDHHCSNWSSAGVADDGNSGLAHGSADGFCRVLREKYETSVVPGSFFGMEQHFRLGICCPTATLITGLERLADALSKR